MVADGTPLRILPDGCIDFLWSQDEAGVAGKIVGAMTEAALFSPRGRVRIAAVRFKPGGAAPFLPCPADQLTDAEDALAAPQLEDALASSTGGKQQARLLEAELLARLPQIPAPEPRATTATRQLAAGASVAQAAQAVDVSRQYLNRLFASEIGLRPKTFARIMRLQRLRRIRRTGARWADAAVQAGYSDQAHLIRECRALSGVTPLQLG